MIGGHVPPIVGEARPYSRAQQRDDVGKTLSNGRAAIPFQAGAQRFVGYADPDSPGGRLRASQPGDAISRERSISPSRCGKVQAFNFSAHASRETIRAYVQRQPRKLIPCTGIPPRSAGWRKRCGGFAGDEVII
jgi:hypothetical protein